MARYGGVHGYDWTEFPRGCPLKLHQIQARLTYLPSDSATATEQNGGRPMWSRTEVLLVSIFHLFSKKPHYLVKELDEAGKLSRAQKARELFRRDRERRIAAGIPLNPLRGK